jgi:signal transduction histidine kinase
LSELRDLDRQRAEIWHEAAHDLRGNVGLVTTTTSILTEDGIPDTLRTRAFTLLQANVTSLQSLLEDLLSLARLEAGREELQLQTFDASVLLQDLSATFELLAQEKGLYLQTEGPESLVVQVDPAKIRRILQNLTLNALKYTEHGGITLSWGTTRERDIDRWLFRVRDTGPGMPFAPGGPVTAELREATRTSKKVEDRAGSKDVEPVSFFPPAFLPDGFQRPGEGVGLLIVKRLCELLQATIEVASAPGEGTVFQVVLPRDYERSSR